MTKKNNVEKQFDNLFSHKSDKVYDFNSKKLSRKDKGIISCLENFGLKEKKCLDIGPGTGRWIQFIAGNKPDCIAAIDISSESLSRCSSNCEYLQKANLELDKFDFKDDFFDVVISFEVLEHLQDPSNYLKEIQRVTKPGGLILMSLPNIASFISRVRLLLGVLPPAIANDPTHVSFYRKKDIAKLMKNIGLSATFIPTSISINPLTHKGILRIPSNRYLSQFDDSLLFYILNK
jgi:2-polyprenyl-3-methyl-5-hydroxy-6-metoxy-1,4-benzoquinol methylase